MPKTPVQRRSILGSIFGSGLTLGRVARARWSRALIGAGVGLVVAAAPSVAAAGPVDEVMDAYFTATEQFGNFELDASLATLDAAIANAQAQGLGSHPALASLQALRAGLIWTLTQDSAATMAACIEAYKIDYNVELPIELRSAELQQICGEGHSAIAAPTTGIVHTPPPATPNADIEFVALANAQIPPGGQLVLYWRPAGAEAEFIPVQMKIPGDGVNWGYVTITKAEHQGKDIQYFFYAFDMQLKQLGSIGDKTAPLLLKMDESAVAAGGTTGDEGDEGDEDDEGDTRKPREKRDRGKGSGLPRVFINLGVGTGVGIARGTAELTYEQYTPGLPNAIYSQREQACAVERWFAAGSDLASDPVVFSQHVDMIRGIGANALPVDSSDSATLTQFNNSYDAAYCNRRHPVSTGLALAPFHIAPEVGVRVGRAVVLSLYGRLQVVTGSRVFTDDPGKELNQSFNIDVKSPMPAGFRQRPPFSFAIGVKAKYFFGKDERKFRVFAGGFAGYGFARLRVPMGFSNDRNGNSVPDAVDTALHGPLDADGNVDPDQCTVVWPYTAGCDQSSDGMADRNLALAVRSATPATDERIDTVVIGPGMLGILVGFHYQFVKHFAVFAELNVGGWFPQTSSLLFDLNLGPSLTF